MRSSRSVTPIELLAILVVAAALGMVAVPWWQAQRQSALAAEASDNVRRILRGAAAYYGAPHQVGSKTVTCTLPESAGSTPTGTSCCIDQNDADADDRCDAKPLNWTNATWQALQFSLTDQHFCVYEWQAAATANGAWTMAATAHADMDCDTTMSTFRLAGTAGKASDGTCTFVPGKAIFRDHELE